MTKWQNHEIVYFVRRPSDQAIKIGVTRDLRRRLHNLGVASKGLMLLATIGGGRTSERHLHRHFAADSIGHEWFQAGNDLLEFVRLAAAGDPSAEQFARGGSNPQLRCPTCPPTKTRIR